MKLHMSSGVVELLTSSVSDDSPLDPGSAITYANDLTIAQDGTIYFTSCSDIIPSVNHLGFYDTFRAWVLDMVQVRGGEADMCTVG